MILLAALAAGTGALWVWQGAPARRQARTEAMLRVRLPEVRLEGVTLAQAVETLRRLSGADLSAELALQTDAADEQIDIRLRDVTLDQALTALTGYLQPRASDYIVHFVHDGRIVLAPADRVGHRPYVRVYDISDIYSDLPEPAPVFDHTTPTDGSSGAGALFNDRSPDVARTRAEYEEELARLLKESCHPDAWYDAGGPLAMVNMPGRLVVLADSETHGQIADLLRQLREPEPAREERR